MTTPNPETPDLDRIAATLRDAIVPSTRIDGWTGAKQRRFLEAIADGDTVRDACALVHLSTQSAYALRRRAAGRAFDLGWRAADLLARERVAADLLIRAVEGQVVEITRADGSSVTKHHHDNRLAVQMLNRLDRYADASGSTAPGHAARLVAGDFDAYLDIVAREGGPARAGLFMLARAEGDDAAALEPVVALARADRHLRCGALADDVDVTDLDPAARSGWTAAQWARAEAAGLLVLAPPAPAPQAPASTHQPVSTWLDPEDRPEPVWWCEDADDWRTRFPPPAGFLGDEEGRFGDPGYQRALDSDEADAAERRRHAEVAEQIAAAAPERDRWFAACPPEPDDEDDGDDWDPEWDKDQEEDAQDGDPASASRAIIDQAPSPRDPAPGPSTGLEPVRGAAPPRVLSPERLQGDVSLAVTP